MFARSAPSLLRASRRAPRSLVLRRTVIAAPRPGQPILERRPDRDLPDLGAPRRKFLISLPFFFLAVGASAAAIFNYQKSSSSVVSSTLYSLRVNDEARAILGDEIQYASKFPWISGELNQFGGCIDIRYRVKGRKCEGTVHFRSTRKERRGFFHTEVWELELDDGRRLNLLENTAGPIFEDEE
ncbi:DUF1783-domain-containing protein [Ascodesmis nigricans]|uniref:DUF1783-domain-containing protein n=1 Tax=Ascodesmis nigricans TaxID=341454 RepID=A0A4S2N436_9PEZI|nr:DUF1783-domain-containing protein [Ascodesmis nigricans]